MKSKPQFALSSSYESVQCLLKVLGKASMSVLLSSLVRDHTLEQSTPHSNPLLNHRSGVLFFFLILTVCYKSILLFSTSILPDHRHLGQERERCTERTKEKTPELCRGSPWRI